MTVLAIMFPRVEHDEMTAGPCHQGGLEQAKLSR